jgi:uncharacterized protein with HEPN domain
MSERNPVLLLDDIIEAATKITQYIQSYSFEQFKKDSKTSDAVIRNFEIIGEAANRLPEDFKDQSTDIDWNRIRGFRNRIVHDYFGIDYSIVWEIIQDFLPSLISSIKKIKKDITTM